MKEFILKTIGYSTKRILSIAGMIIFLAVVICSLCQIAVPYIVYYSLLTIILGNGTMTLFQGTKKDGV